MTTTTGNGAYQGHEISFGTTAATFKATEVSDGQGYVTMDGLFHIAPKAKGSYIVLRSSKDGMKRNLHVAFEVTDDDLPNAKGVQVGEDYLIDGFIKDSNPPKMIAIQSIGRLLTQCGYSEADAQAAMSKLPGLGATSDKAREVAFASAVEALIVGKPAVAFLKAVAKADGSKLISVIEKFSNEGNLALAKSTGNGFRLQQDKEALNAVRAANAMGNKKGGGRPGAKPGAVGGASDAPKPAIDFDKLMGGGA